MRTAFDLTTHPVRCQPSGREARLASDGLLLDAVTQVGLPLGQSCDGVALCGFCRIQVVEGAANLTPAAAREQELLGSLKAGPDERLACCARVRGPVKITTTYW